jgi:hypothetical protein
VARDRECLHCEGGAAVIFRPVAST